MLVVEAEPRQGLADVLHLAQAELDAELGELGALLLGSAVNGVEDVLVHLAVAGDGGLDVVDGLLVADADGFHGVLLPFGSVGFGMVVIYNHD